MTDLKKNLEFSIVGKDRLTQKTIEYFQKSGFELIYQKDNSLKFRRGSIVSNMWTFNPLKWKSEIVIEIVEESINAVFYINTFGQTVTIREEKLWNTFIENYRLYLTSGIDFKASNSKELIRTKINSLKYVGWAFLGAVICGVPAGIIAYMTGVDSIATVGAVGGAMTLLIKKIDEEKSENSL